MIFDDHEICFILTWWYLAINHDQSWFPNSSWERNYPFLVKHYMYFRSGCRKTCLLRNNDEMNGWSLFSCSQVFLLMHPNSVQWNDFYPWHSCVLLAYVLVGCIGPGVLCFTRKLYGGIPMRKTSDDMSSNWTLNPVV